MSWNDAVFNDENEYPKDKKTLAPEKKLELIVEYVENNFKGNFNSLELAPKLFGLLKLFHELGLISLNTFKIKNT